MQILDLGCGDLSEVNKLDAEITAIDRKPTDNHAKHVNFIQADFFDVELNQDFDLIRAHYSLCFNSRERIEKNFPEILKHLKSGGKFEIRDFHTDDGVVKKRTNLYAPWFFDLVKKYIGDYSIRDEKVYEPEHGHEHHIFILETEKK